MIYLDNSATAPIDEEVRDAMLAPQIRLLQDNDQEMLEKIQSSLVNTIPLWRHQMVLQKMRRV